jgi:uncharacterized protein (TIGR03437 family)
VIDGFARVRRLGADGVLRTVAGSARTSVAAGGVGDGGPATNAALNNPRQVFPFADGSFWIRDLGGRQLRIVGADGIIQTVNNNFDTSINLMPLADGRPAAITANRVYPFRSNGVIETGAAPYTPFTGSPLAIDRQGALYFIGSERPELRNPLIRLNAGAQSAVASAPVASLVDGQAPPFGVWFEKTNSLIYSASIGGKTGIVESRPGQSARFVVGGGTDIGDPEGKDAASLAIFGIVSFSADGQGRIVVADASRRRILVVGADNKVTVLKAGGEPVIFAPLGAFSTTQRIAADNDGNIYWYTRGATPTGGVFTADLSVWRRADGSVTQFTVPGLVTLFRLDDGSAAVIAGNATNFRSVYRVSPAGLSDLVEPYRFLPLTSVVQWRGLPYFTAAGRLFRGAPGAIQMLDTQYLPTGAAFNPSFVTASPDTLLVRLGDSGFYRIENLDSCHWAPQPRIDAVVNTASFEYPDTVAPYEWLTVFGSGLGPAGGQGLILNASLRAGGQSAPYPTLTLGNFSGAIPNASLTGTTLPVLYSDDRQMVVQSLSSLAAQQYLLYFTWQGLQLIYPAPLRTQATAPALFVQGGARDGVAAALNEDGTRHSASSPAAPGTVLRLFATGLGAHETTLPTGDFYSPITALRLAVLPAVFLDDRPVEVRSAMGMPGMLGGAVQIDIVIPPNAAAGEHVVRLDPNSDQHAAIYVKV